MIDLAASNSDALVNSAVTVHPIRIDQEFPNWGTYAYLKGCILG